MNDQDTEVVYLTWDTTEHHGGYFRVRRGFDPDDHDLSTLMSDFDADCFIGLARDNFEIHDDQPPPESPDDVVELELDE